MVKKTFTISLVVDAADDAAANEVADLLVDDLRAAIDLFVESADDREVDAYPRRPVELAGGESLVDAIGHFGVTLVADHEVSGRTTAGRLYRVIGFVDGLPDEGSVAVDMLMVRATSAGEAQTYFERQTTAGYFERATAEEVR